MTRAAMNINSELGIPLRHIIRNPLGVIVVDETVPANNGRPCRHEQLQTPAGTRNNIDEWGWRNPSAWSANWIRCNPCPIGTITAVDGSGYESQYIDGWGWSRDQDTLPANAPPELLGRALNSALTKLKKVNGGVNLGQNFAEREQAVLLFNSTCRRISNGWEAIKKRDPLLLRKVIDASRSATGPRNRGYPEAYLEYMYGVSPAMSDVDDAVDALHKAIKGRAPVVSVIGKASLNVNLDQTVKSFGNVPLSGMRLIGMDRMNAKVRLDYCLQNDLVAALSSLGILNPMSILWELSPYSFVSDWFTNVGQWIELMDAAYGYSFKGGTASVIVRRKAVGSWEFKPSSNWKSASYAGEPFTIDSGRFIRTVYPTSPLPWFGLKNPFPKNGVHVAEGIALIAGSFR